MASQTYFIPSGFQQDTRDAYFIPSGFQQDMHVAKFSECVISLPKAFNIDSVYPSFLQVVQDSFTFFRVCNLK